jgi:hypothetical protein
MSGVFAKTARSTHLLDAQRPSDLSSKVWLRAAGRSPQTPNWVGSPHSRSAEATTHDTGSMSMASGDDRRATRSRTRSVIASGRSAS